MERNRIKKIRNSNGSSKNINKTFTQKRVSNYKFSVCHVIKVNRGVLRVKTFEMGEKEKIRIEYEFVMINVKSFKFSAHIWFLAN